MADDTTIGASDVAVLEVGASPPVKVKALETFSAREARLAAASKAGDDAAEAERDARKAALSAVLDASAKVSPWTDDDQETEEAKGRGTARRPPDTADGAPVTFDVHRDAVRAAMAAGTVYLTDTACDNCGTALVRPPITPGQMRLDCGGCGRVYRQG